MDAFDVLNLICGLALFLYGMDVMGNGLKRSAGKKLKTILGNLTSNKFKAFILGLGVTAVIQSSSATTVMVVGFVNSGTMLLSQAVGVIMGANVGTAVTAWLTALNGIEGGAEATAWLKWLKPDAWMPILALIGICLIMFAKKEKKKDIGTILLGFAVLMVGMATMSDAVSGLRGDPNFQRILTMFRNPILGVLAGTVLTAIVQSSSASVGILQALSTTGVITFGMGMPIILGQNIGTCVTAMISALSANKNGKRAALVHLYFNVIGVVLWMSCYYGIGWILRSTGTFDLFALADNTFMNMWLIAGTHTVFKLFSVVFLMPFTQALVKLAENTIKGADEKGDEYTSKLDERLLDTPSVAIENSYAVARRMAEMSKSVIYRAISLLRNYDEQGAREVEETEDLMDNYNDTVASYLVKLSARRMREEENNEVSKLLYLIGDFERICDHAMNIRETAEELHEFDGTFSAAAEREVGVMCGAVKEILNVAVDTFLTGDLSQARKVEPLEQVVDDLKDRIRMNHAIRLQNKQCTIELGWILSDLVTDLERVSDHCSNIAGCLVEMAENASLQIHVYSDRQKKEASDYAELYAQYCEKYAIAAEI